MNSLAGYLCLGDSMSIDLYPYTEIAQYNPEIRRNIGAASLLHNNESNLWPAYKGKDLLSRYPEIPYFNLAEDGACTFHFLDTCYLDLVRTHLNEALLVTLTIGGNDLLDLVGRPGAKDTRKKSELDESFASLKDRFARVVDLICTNLPRSILILNSVFDPSDGTGRLSEFMNYSDKLEYLHSFNRFVQEKAERSRSMFADIHGHFLGHGISAPQEERWYWQQNPIEPGARGASEIRRLWVNALKEHDLL